MKKFLLPLLMLGSAFASSQAANHLVVNKGLDDEQSFAFSDLERLNFVAGGLEFAAGESQIIPFGKIATIHFSSESSADRLTAQTGQDFAATVNASHTLLSLSGYEEGSPVEIFAITGRRVLLVPSYRGQSLDISALAPGVYIVKSGSHARKFVK